MRSGAGRARHTLASERKGSTGRGTYFYCGCCVLGTTASALWVFSSYPVVPMGFEPVLSP